jgi:hypothetical protein
MSKCHVQLFTGSQSCLLLNHLAASDCPEYQKAEQRPLLTVRHVCCRCQIIIQQWLLPADSCIISEYAHDSSSTTSCWGVISIRKSSPMNWKKTGTGPDLDCSPVHQVAIYRNSPNQSSCQSLVLRNIVELKKTGSSRLVTGPIIGTYIGPCFHMYSPWFRFLGHPKRSRIEQDMTKIILSQVFCRISIPFVVILITCATKLFDTTGYHPRHRNNIPKHVYHADFIHLTSLTSGNYILQTTTTNYNLNATYDSNSDPYTMDQPMMYFAWACWASQCGPMYTEQPNIEEWANEQEVSATRLDWPTP